MARRLLLAVSLAGCFNFDLLRSAPDDLTPPKDLSGADDLSEADLAAADLAAADLAAADLAAADLTGEIDLLQSSDMARPCGPRPSPAVLNVFHVAPGGNSDAGTASDPFGSIEDAVAAGVAQGGRFAVLLAEGEYPGALHLPVGPANQTDFYGGYHEQFACRDVDAARSVIRSTQDAVPALTISANADVKLDGITFVGKLPADPTKLAIAVDVGAATAATFEGCQMLSHEPLTAKAGHAVGLRAHNLASPTVRRSVIRSGAVNPSGVPGTTSTGALFCNANGTVEDSEIAASGGATASQTYGVRVSPDDPSGGLPDCGGPITHTVEILRCRASAHGGDYTTGVYLAANNTQKVSLNFFGSAASAWDGTATAFAVNGTSTSLQPSLQSSTLYVPSTASPTSAGYRSNALNLTQYGFTDSIVEAPLPLEVVASPTPAPDFGGTNVYFTSAGPTLMHLLTSSPPSNLNIDFTEFEITWQNAAALFGDPMIDVSNGYQLSGSSLVEGAASVCLYATDVDGQPRPQPSGGTCDVGADET